MIVNCYDICYIAIHFFFLNISFYYTQPKKGKNRKKCRKKLRGQIKFQLNLTQHKYGSIAVF
jgi:hypothetical protein